MEKLIVQCRVQYLSRNYTNNQSTIISSFRPWPIHHNPYYMMVIIIIKIFTCMESIILLYSILLGLKYSIVIYKSVYARDKT